MLDAFPELGADVGTNELSRVTGINPSTVSRILATLAAAGYVEHLPATGRYRLGPQVLRLSTHALGGVDLRSAARPHLDDLVDETGETATLSVPGDRDAVTIDFVLSRAERRLGGAGRAPERSPRHRDRQGDALRSRPRSCRSLHSRATRTGRSPTRRGWRRRWRPCAGSATPMRRASVSRP